MNEAMREMLGQALYEAHLTHPTAVDTMVPPWEEQHEQIKSRYRDSAQAVVTKLGELLVPATILILFSEEQIRNFAAQALTYEN
jgi:hypothetical protein